VLVKLNYYNWGMMAMTDCKECKRLRNKLSPLEDKSFTEAYQRVEPVEYYRASLHSRNGSPYVVIRLCDAWAAAFPKTPYTVLDLTKLGRTFDALGWERTKRNGITHFALKYDEFLEMYDV